MTDATRTLARLGLLIVLLSPGCAPADDAGEGAKAALQAFYAAMGRGDAAGAMALIAPDAVFLESGQLETRAQYEMNHLPNDIDFERQVPGRRGPVDVKTEGNTAWIIQSTDFDGMFEGVPVSFTSRQLAVLTRGDSGWLIRSIHWSSAAR